MGTRTDEQIREEINSFDQLADYEFSRWCSYCETTIDHYECPICLGCRECCPPGDAHCNQCGKSELKCEEFGCAGY